MTTACLNNMADCELVVDGDSELPPLPGAKGKVWRYYGFQARSGEFIERDKQKRNVVVVVVFFFLFFFRKQCLQSMKYCGT